MRLLTRDLAGTGGLAKATPEDFLVEELPAYPPSGHGPHTFLLVEKRGLTTEEMLTRLSGALRVSRRDAGVAGQKDRQALTRQWVSLPGVEPARALAVELEGVRVLEAHPHGHKLRTGHLRGNRFTLILRGVGEDALPRARAILARLAERGVPNYYGPQRFGARGDNAARGKALITGGADGGGRRVGGSERRLLVSAYQSGLFNRYLERRLEDGLHATALLGDVMQKRDTGGLFVVDEAGREDVAARLAAGALAVTGPMFGHKMMAPPAETPAAAREQALLTEEGLGSADFARAGALAEGTRRPLLVPLADASVMPGHEPGTLVLRFALPAGSYATVLVAEVTKG